MAGALVPYAALLRGVNVGGRNRLAMADLRSIAAELGFVGARTLLQSGNLVFRAPAADHAFLAGPLSAALSARLGLVAPVIVRARDALDAIVAANPFSQAARDDPARLLVVFLDSEPPPEGVAALMDLATAGEAVEIQGREAFIHYPEGIARSRLVQGAIDRRLGVMGTARNWNTVLALVALAAELAGDFEAGGKAG